MGALSRLPYLPELGPMVALARHGQTDDNVEPLRFQGRTDTPLNQTGEGQAKRLAEMVVGLGFEAVWTSNLSRARATADAVCDRLGLEQIVDARLSEGYRGRWEGRLMADVEAAEPEMFASWRRPDPDFRFPEGESIAEHQDRVAEVLEEIRETGLSTLVVCHGGSMRTVLCSLSGLGLAAFHQWDIPNCAMVRL